MKTFTTETLPVTVSILSRWIDLSGDHPQFKFMLELKCGERRMNQEYGGGILAFGARESKAVKMELASQRRTLGSNALLGHLLNGGRLIDKEKERAWLGFMLEHSKVSAASVCSSLVMDTRAGEETFSDFCSNFGYDEDSRKAFEIYMACQKCGQEFRKLVGADFEAIETALQDY